MPRNGKLTDDPTAVVELRVALRLAVIALLWVIVGLCDIALTIDPSLCPVHPFTTEHPGTSGQS